MSSDCRNATAALVCYDITSYETFANLQRWVDKITLEAEKNCRSDTTQADDFGCFFRAHLRGVCKSFC